MTIDKSLQQKYADQDNGLNKVLKYVSADRDDGNWRDKKNLPINVIPFPFKKSFKDELEEMEREKKRLEKDKKTFDPESINIKLASAPHLDDRWFGLWEDLDGQGIVPLGIKTLTDFKRWFYKQELDVEMFSRGGIASLIRAKRRYG